MVSADVNFNFRFSLFKAVLAIVVFVLSYIALFFFAIGVTILFALGGIALFIAYPSFITLVIGLGLIGAGVMVLFYLIKFLFSFKKADNSHLFEITKTDEPHLFKLVEEVVQGVGTNFPKKIYLSTDVNAYVFYHSSFWSMFLPIKKNLVIGVGLLNTVTEEEFKAILAHEFGHFSQKSMKVGSYVYYVNRIIYNLLFENEGINNFFESMSNVSGIFYFILSLAVIILNLIQSVLKELYSLVNKAFLGLSREMEFQADEIAVKLTGTDDLKNALLRISLAEASLTEVFNYYDSRFNSNITSSGIFQEQLVVLNLIAKKNDLTYDGIFPIITTETLNKFNKSKLVVKDQWASHPPLEERIERMNPFIKNETKNPGRVAGELLTNFSATEKKLTAFIFDKVKYNKPTTSQNLQSFEEDLIHEFEQSSLPKFYNGYYDYKIPIKFEIDNVQSNSNTTDVNEFFSNEKVELVNQLIGLSLDINSLIQISENKEIAPTFEYNGIKYKQIDSFDLYPKLQNEEKVLVEKLKENDIAIYSFFKNLEEKLSKTKELKSLYNQLFTFDTKAKTYSESIFNVQNNLYFVSETLPFERIQENFETLKPLESKLKEFLRFSLNNEYFNSSLREEDKDLVYLYIHNELNYFSAGSYKEDQLEKLFNVLKIATTLLNSAYFYYKKKILIYQQILLSENNLYETPIEITPQ